MDRKHRVTLAQRLNELAVANSEGLLKCVPIYFSPVCRLMCVFSFPVMMNTECCGRVCSRDSRAAQLCLLRNQLFPSTDTKHVEVKVVKDVGDFNMSDCACSYICMLCRSVRQLTAFFQFCRYRSSFSFSTVTQLSCLRHGGSVSKTWRWSDSVRVKRC